MADTIKSVKPGGGGDYLSLVSWDANEAGTVGAPDRHICNIDADVGSEDPGYLYLDTDWDVQGELIIQRDPAAQNAIIKPNGGSSAHAIEVRTNNTTFSGILVDGDDMWRASEEGFRIEDADNVQINKCSIINLAAQDQDGIYVKANDDQNRVIEIHDTEVINTHRSGILAQTAIGLTVHVINCSLYKIGSNAKLGYPAVGGQDGRDNSTTTFIAVNTIAHHLLPSTNPCFKAGEGVLLGDYCAGNNDGMPPGSNNLIDCVFQDTTTPTGGNRLMFQSLASGAEDLHLIDDAGNSAIDAGAGPDDPTWGSYVALTDYDGDARSGLTCNIGFDEFEGTGPVPEFKTVNDVGAGTDIAAVIFKDTIKVVNASGGGDYLLLQDWDNAEAGLVPAGERHICWVHAEPGNEQVGDLELIGTWDVQGELIIRSHPDAQVAIIAPGLSETGAAIHIIGIGNVTIDNIYIYGDGVSNQSDEGIRIEDSDNIVIRNTKIDNFTRNAQDGIEIVSSGAVPRTVTIEGCKIYNVRRSGILVNAAQNFNLICYNNTLYNICTNSQSRYPVMGFDNNSGLDFSGSVFTAVNNIAHCPSSNPNFSGGQTGQMFGDHNASADNTAPGMNSIINCLFQEGAEPTGGNRIKFERIADPPDLHLVNHPGNSAIDAGAGPDDPTWGAGVPIFDVDGIMRFGLICDIGFDEIGPGEPQNKEVWDSAASSDDLGPVAAAFAMSDIGAGDDTPTDLAAAFAMSDIGAGDDTPTDLAAAFAMGDVGAGNDTPTDLAAALAQGDTGAGTDDVTPFVSLILSDTSFGLDAITILSALLKQIADTGAGTDVISGIFATASVSDIATGADISTPLANVSVADLGAGADLADVITATLKSIAESASGLDSIGDLLAGAGVSDTAAGFDSTQINVALSLADGATALDVVSVMQTAIKLIADAGAGLDDITPVSITLAVPDVGSGDDIPGMISALLDVAQAAGGVDSVVAFDTQSKIASIRFTFSRRAMGLGFSRREITSKLN